MDWKGGKGGETLFCHFERSEKSSSAVKGESAESGMGARRWDRRSGKHL